MLRAGPGLSAFLRIEYSFVRRNVERKERVENCRRRGTDRGGDGRVRARTRFRGLARTILCYGDVCEDPSAIQSYGATSGEHIGAFIPVIRGVGMVKRSQP